MERTSSISRKTISRQHKAEVMIAGEQLRYAWRGHRAFLRKDSTFVTPSSSLISGSFFAALYLLATVRLHLKILLYRIIVNLEFLHTMIGTVVLDTSHCNFSVYW